jgi:hypothetical protein
VKREFESWHSAVVVVEDEGADAAQAEVEVVEVVLRAGMFCFDSEMDGDRQFRLVDCVSVP